MLGIILAGGSGSRLWPLSRELYPKQLLNLYGDKTLLQNTFERLARFISKDKIVSLTNKKHFGDVRFQIGELSSNPLILCEPVSKNTAAAIACSLKYAQQRFGDDEIVLIVPSDHLIKDNDGFIETVKDCIEIAENNKIVTFGIRPEFPETGYGYIKAGEPYLKGFKAERFTEKPDVKTAEKYLEEGCYFWNGGMFAGKVSVFLEEFQKYAPEIFKNLKDIDFSNSEKIPSEMFEKMPSISIDYAVMEKSDRIVVVPLKSDWSDLGSWQALYDAREKDENGNVICGNTVTDNVKNSFIYSSDKLVTATGLENVIIVETEDAVMVCGKDCSQNVKNIYERLKKKEDSAAILHKTVIRPWGTYTCMSEGDGYLTKVIRVNPKQRLSIQSHNYRSEHWVVLEGNALVILDGKEYRLCQGQSIDIPIYAKHSLQNPSDEPLKIIEVQKGSYISEDDIIRYEDIYGRV